MSYHVELSEAALQDLHQFNQFEALAILGTLQALQDTPKPTGVQVIPMGEAADGLAYCYEISEGNIFYNIYEETYLVRVVAIFKRTFLN